MRRGPAPHDQRAGRRRDPPGHQGIRQLADHSAALYQGRIHWRLGHHDGDVPERRTAAAAGRLSPAPGFRVTSPLDVGFGPAASAQPATRVRRIIVAITGASGAIYGVRLLQVLQGLRDSAGVESHLLMSPAGLMNVQHELHMTREEVEALAHVVHNVRDVGATIASGSFAAEAMVVAPCSMKTLAAVAHGLSDNLIARAADVTLKERRRLILMVRETPLNLAHLRNMTAVTEMGGIVFPPVPGFYQRPKTIDDLVDHTVGRMLDLLGLPQTLAASWPGLYSAE
ncbi:3-polyprenyl-4-hydroxybenzoate decarboxylase ubiX [Ralstonia solanacearum UW551]|uniref:Flavin prenyltransferase UbiX n=1 Tax=Ralstonia solanacearum (strain UW551) TaxID=342110 RepID=A0AB33VFK7_RALSU|nr:3-polyprenyl-4-hydroxybenzoate decarboxylase ubiX [Ralstonia solanacearum UW551]